MKKTYQIPTTNAIKIDVTNMIAASPDGFSKSLNTTGTDGGNALSRGGFFDDDDEE